jgi:peptidoglycan glycosyltransferase
MMARALDTLRMVAGLAAAVALIGYGLAAEQGISDARWLALLGLGWMAALIGLWPRLPKEWGPFPRSTVKAALLFASLFVLISVQLVRIQVIEQAAIASRTGADPVTGDAFQNPRLVDFSLARNRGSIYDRNGTLIAGVTVIDGVGYRSYPDSSISYVTGYYSPLLYGLTGLESSFDRELRGESGGSVFDEALDRLLHRQPGGNNLVLTIDSELQRYAQDLLGPRTGAVVVLDIETGATLVLASNPHYDPARLTHTPDQDRDAIAAYWNTLLDDDGRPLLLRATGGLYTPGSTFKTITAAAAIDAGFANPATVYEDNGVLIVDGREFYENNRPDDSIDFWTLQEGYGFSLNLVFAQVGLEIGQDTLVRYGERFGFGTHPPYDIEVAPSQLANNPHFLNGQTALAETAFGQGQLLTTPLHMALVAACIANGGDMMAPFLVQSITDQNGATLQTTDPSVWRSPISQSTAESMQQLMIYAVEQGAIGGAIVPGYVVGGKTGTAEVEGSDPHSWFIGFIGDSQPRYAVAVVLEEGGGEIGAAVTIGQAMLAATIQS